jgi:acetyl esterase/lipase
MKWIAAHAVGLGAEPGRLAVCGWSAGGNLAAVACQLARGAGGPHIAGQVLVNPVTDWDLTRGSGVENAEGYVLTGALMQWFWDHYADLPDRKDPRASPLRATDLSGLPPALIVTSEFDPLRDQGAAYADALAEAGIASRHLPCRGHIHTSLVAVDLIISGAAVRAEIAAALRGFLGAAAAA